MLALPTFALLRRALPEAQLFALVPEYTAPVAELSPAIDQVVVDPGATGAGGSPLALAHHLARYQFDAAIALFSTTRLAVALLAAHIPYRLAPATKLAQVFYNHRLTQRRSRSTQPEFQYNLDLARHYLKTLGIAFDDTLTQPVLAHPAAVIDKRRRLLAEQHGIDPTGRWIFVHPGHGGSANNLSIAQYGALVNALGLKDSHSVLVTAGPGEETGAVALYNAIDGPRKCLHKSIGGLKEFTEVLATADLFVSGSTGPAHLAGALNRRTAVFYPRRATSSPLRWQTLNTAKQRITFTPPVHRNERDMASIDPAQTAAAIREAFPELGLG